MAKKYSFGGMLFFGAVTAALGGIAAYKHRKEIEEALNEISEQLEAREEVMFFSGDVDNIVHTVPTVEQEEGEPESDFVDPTEEGTKEAPEA